MVKEYQVKGDFILKGGVPVPFSMLIKAEGHKAAVQLAYDSVYKRVSEEGEWIGSGSSSVKRSDLVAFKLKETKKSTPVIWLKKMISWIYHRYKDKIIVVIEDFISPIIPL